MKLTIDMSNPDDVAEAAGLLALLQGHTGAVPQPAAPAPAAPAPAPAPAAPPPPAQPAPAPAPAPAPGSITQAEFAAKVQAYAKAHGPKAAKNFLASKGFANTQAVTPDWFPHLIAEMGV